MGLEASYNFRRVSPTVTTSGLVTAEHLADLASCGYELVVNLLPDTHEHALRSEAAIVEEQGVEYVHIPVDFAAPTAEQFDQFADVMDAHAGATIHVHCAANYRVSVFYALYALRVGSWTEEQVDEHVRGLWDPHSDAQWGTFLDAQRARTLEQR